MRAAGAAETYGGRCHELQPLLRFCAYSVGDESAMSELMQMRLKIGPDHERIDTDLDVRRTDTLPDRPRSWPFERVLRSAGSLATFRAKNRTLLTLFHMKIKGFC